jgi:hypothetical protein
VIYLGTFQLIEISHRIKMISLSINTDKCEPNPHILLQILFFFREYARDLSILEFHYVPTVCMIEALKMFPNLTSVQWSQHEGDLWSQDLTDITTGMPTYPNINCLRLTHIVSSLDPQMISSIIKACPNLTSLQCDGVWIVNVLNEVLPSCRQLTGLHISCRDEFTNAAFEEIITLIAKHCTSLKSLTLTHRFAHLSDEHMDLRLETIKTAMKTVIRQVNRLNLDLNFGYAPGDIASLFEPLTDIDLQDLRIQTMMKMQI